jgi:hypothetical protein
LLLQISIEGADFLKRWRWNRLLKRDRALWSHFPPETVLNGLDTTILYLCKSAVFNGQGYQTAVRDPVLLSSLKPQTLRKQIPIFIACIFLWFIYCRSQYLDYIASMKNEYGALAE